MHQLIFFYGSLLDPKLREAVFADSLVGARILSATAHNYVTLKYPGESYPVLVPKEGGKALGEICISAGKEAMDRMEFYEGDQYELSDIPVTLSSGEVTIAKYNRAIAIDGVAFEEPWIFDTWQKTESEALLKITQKYMLLCYGVMSTKDADKVWKALQEQ